MSACAGQLREEQARRAAAEAHAARADATLAELRAEAAALRRAAEEHATCAAFFASANCMQKGGVVQSPGGSQRGEDMR